MSIPVATIDGRRPGCIRTAVRPCTTIRSSAPRSTNVIALRHQHWRGLRHPKQDRPNAGYSMTVRASQTVSSPLDDTSHRFTATIEAGQRRWSGALTPNTKELHPVNRCSSSASVIDPTSRHPAPHACIADNDRQSTRSVVWEVRRQNSWSIAPASELETRVFSNFLLVASALIALHVIQTKHAALDALSAKAPI